MLYLHVFAVAVAVYLYLVQGSGEGGVFLICQFDVRRAEVFRDAALAAHSGVPSTRHGNLPCQISLPRGCPDLVRLLPLRLSFYPNIFYCPMQR